MGEVRGRLRDYVGIFGCLWSILGVRVSLSVCGYLGAAKGLLLVCAGVCEDPWVCYRRLWASGVRMRVNVGFCIFYGRPEEGDERYASVSYMAVGNNGGGSGSDNC